MTAKTTTDQRTGYIAGLRALADVLEQHDDLPLPYTGSHPLASLNWIEVRGDDVAARTFARTFVRAIPGTIDKNVRDNNLDLVATLGGLHVRAILSRDAVCTRRVVGVRQVTEDVPDPDALAAVPTVTVTRTVEDVEWDCGPILADQVERDRSEAGCSCGWRGPSADVDEHPCAFPDDDTEERLTAANDGFLDNADPDMDAAGADDYLAETPA